MSTEANTEVVTFNQAVALKGRKAIEFFSNQENLKPLIAFVEKEATATVFDVKLKKDRDAIGSTALKVSKSRKALADAIKASVSDMEVKVKTAKAASKFMEAELNKIREAVLEPRNVWQAEQDKIEEERVASIRASIDDIQVLGQLSGSETKEQIANLIEGVESIDVSEGFEEFASEAAQAVKDVLKTLNDRVLQIIEEARQREQTEQLQKEKLRNQINERLNNLAMIPMGLLGKSSQDIQKKIDSLNDFNVSQEEFGDSYQQAIDSVQTVLAQLNTMLIQQLSLEKQAPAEVPSQPAIEKPALEIVGETNQTLNSTAPQEPIFKEDDNDKEKLGVLLFQLREIQFPECASAEHFDLVSECRSTLSDMVNEIDATIKKVNAVA